LLHLWFYSLYPHPNSLSPAKKKQKQKKKKTAELQIVKKKNFVFLFRVSSGKHNFIRLSGTRKGKMRMLWFKYVYAL
jgi:hypothetical protein